MRHIEENLQIACVRWYNYQYPHYTRLLHHSPNGGYRNAREAGRFKAMGTRAGFPDLMLLHPLGKAPLFMEFKTEKGKQSENQKTYEIVLSSYGYPYHIVRNFDEFKNLVTAYLDGHD